MDAKLHVTERLESGLLGGPFKKNIDYHDEEVLFKISIEQFGFRSINISVAGEVTTKRLLNVYYRIKYLLWLSEGQFLLVEKATENEIDITQSLIERTLPSLETASFIIGRGNLFDDLTILSQDTLLGWSSIQSELDISFNMMLYSVSNANFPIEVKCAFLIESFIPLFELINDRGIVARPELKKKDSKLQKYLITIIQYHGKDIFRKEIDQDLEKFAYILKETRNLVAHIKKEQGKIVLTSEESVVYIFKLSLLYRVVLLDLLGVPYEKYKNEIIDSVSIFDSNVNLCIKS